MEDDVLPMDDCENTRRECDVCHATDAEKIIRKGVKFGGEFCEDCYAREYDTLNFYD